MLRAARFLAGLDPPAHRGPGHGRPRDGARLEIVSAERIRDEFDKLITLDHPTAGLWFLVETGLADQFLPELPAMRLEHDPIHRHKDVLTHTFAVIENVRPPAEQPAERPDFDFRIVRLAALFHDIGKPRTRGYAEGKGTTFPSSRRCRCPDDEEADDRVALLERRCRRGGRTRRLAPQVPHLPTRLE